MDNQYQLLPEGEYIVTLDSYEEKLNNKGNGKRGTLVFKIAKGDQKDRRIFSDLNVYFDNPNEGQEKSVEIAENFMSKFLIATGEADEGLESVGNNREALQEFVGVSPVIAVVGHRDMPAYTNKDGIEVAAKKKAVIKTFKQR